MVARSIRLAMAAAGAAGRQAGSLSRGRKMMAPSFNLRRRRGKEEVSKGRGNGEDGGKELLRHLPRRWRRLYHSLARIKV
jgi:hypothetical protein